MRIAVSGSPRVGKTTLVEALARRLPALDVRDEPYVEMVEEGHLFSQPPTAADYAEQLAYSIEALREAPADALFDRCPVDFLAYLLATSWGETVASDVLDRVGRAMGVVDLVVYVPVEDPDRVEVTPSDDPEESRGDVDAILRAILLDDRFDMIPDVVEVRGPVQARVETVLRRLSRRG